MTCRSRWTLKCGGSPSQDPSPYHHKVALVTAWVTSLSVRLRLTPGLTCSQAAQVLANEGLRKGAWGIDLGVLSLQTRRSLRLGRKTRDGNLELQGLGPLGKFARCVNSTHLEVKVSPR